MPKPEPGKLYALTGAPGTKNIAAGNTWAESEVPKNVLELKKELKKLERKKKKTPGDGWAKLKIKELIEKETA